jgi:hypothetical protein
MQASFLTTVFLPIGLAIVMLGMGLSLIPEDFQRVTRYPKAVAVMLILYGRRFATRIDREEKLPVKTGDLEFDRSNRKKREFGITRKGVFPAETLRVGVACAFLIRSYVGLLRG